MRSCTGRRYARVAPSGPPATVPRMRANRVEEWPIFGPIALGGLGHLPPTIQDRSIVLRMRPKRRDEAVESFRIARVVRDADGLRDTLATWAVKAVDAIAT